MAEQIFGQNDRNWFCCIGIECPDFDVFDGCPNREGRIGGQGPGGSGPGQDIEIRFNLIEQLFRFFVADYFELGDAGSILYVLVTARLVQLMGTESRSGSRRVWLDGIALVQQVFVVK